MSDRSIRVQIGPGFAGTLFIAFLVLKLCGFIAWSWWWVTAPLWVPVVLAVVAIVVCGVVMVVDDMNSRNRKAKRCKGVDSSEPLLRRWLG